jgi:hypothetical protein
MTAHRNAALCITAISTRNPRGVSLLVSLKRHGEGAR